MELNYNEQRCLDGFLAEVRSRDRPVLGILHQICCHQADIGCLVGEDSYHTGASPNLTIQPLNHVGG